MVNTEDFIKRLELLLDYYSLNASAFADKIGVQRSSLSHLLSGRNKPSLDFIMKILEVFPEVDLYWILNGKGSFPKNAKVNENQISVPEELSTPTPILKNETTHDLFSQLELTVERNVAEEPKFSENPNMPTASKESEIDKIVLFYKNGTFKIYNPS
jgi:transcriptional regulator with XRE-family HTH domain